MVADEMEDEIVGDPQEVMLLNVRELQGKRKECGKLEGLIAAMPRPRMRSPTFPETPW